MVCSRNGWEFQVDGEYCSRYAIPTCIRFYKHRELSCCNPYSILVYRAEKYGSLDQKAGQRQGEKITVPKKDMTFYNIRRIVLYNLSGDI